MDAAKALAIGIANDAPLLQILDQPGAYTDQCLPLTCIPTTAGSGSDVTPYATVWDIAAGRKRSLSHAWLLPVASWIDPQLMCSAPASVTATSGLDALSHALEAVWSRNHTPETDALAASASRLILQNLATAVSSPHDLNARAAMARAALAGGLAISRTQSAAAHATSYAMTLRYGVTHGHACAVSLPWLLRRHARTHPLRLAFLIDALGFQDAGVLADAIESLIAVCGLPTRLRELDIPRDELPELARQAMASDRMQNTLLIFTTAELHEELLTIW
jgi:alcohol dehydrogenase class IV